MSRRWEVLPDGTIVSPRGCGWLWVDGEWAVDCDEETHYDLGCPEPPRRYAVEGRELAQADGAS